MKLPIPFGSLSSYARKVLEQVEKSEKPVPVFKDDPWANELIDAGLVRYRLGKIEEVMEIGIYEKHAAYFPLQEEADFKLRTKE